MLAWGLGVAKNQGWWSGSLACGERATHRPEHLNGVPRDATKRVLRGRKGFEVNLDEKVGRAVLAGAGAILFARTQVSVF